MTRSVLLLFSLVACGPKEQPVEALPAPVEPTPAEAAPVEEQSLVEPVAIALSAEEIALQNLAALDAAAGGNDDARRAIIDAHRQLIGGKSSEHYRMYGT